MKRETIIRAWKDPQFRASLTSEERSALPDCPAGQAFTELDESELQDAVGGALVAYDFEDGCICSNWTVPTTKWTTSRVLPVNQYDVLTLDQGALNVTRYY